MLFHHLDYVQNYREEFTLRKYTKTLSEICHEARETVQKLNPDMKFDNPNLYKKPHINKMEIKKKRKLDSANKENNSGTCESYNATIVTEHNNNSSIPLIRNSQITVSRYSSNSQGTSIFNDAISLIPETQTYQMPTTSLNSFNFINYEDEDTREGAPNF